MGVGPLPDRYTITGQEKSESLTPDGRFVESWRISFETPSGTHSYIRLPDAQYTPETVDALIREDIAKIEGVHRLGITPAPPTEEP